MYATLAHRPLESRLAPAYSPPVAARPQDGAGLGARPSLSQLSSAPIQRVVRHPSNQVPAAIRSTLHQHIQAYNLHVKGNLGNTRKLHGAFARLDAIEGTVNRHLLNNTQISDDHRRELFQVLRSTQEEHVALTSKLLAGNHPLWLRPGAAGTHSKRSIHASWAALRDETGNVRFAAHQPQEFKDRMMSAYAKLLQGSHGQRLLSDLLAAPAGGAGPITVKAGSESSADPPKTPDTFYRVQAANGAVTPGTPAVAGVEMETPSPLGTPLPAFDRMQEDVHGKPLFEPHFITVGHEFGHARHHITGMTAKDWTQSTNLPALASDEERHKWSSLEEYENINNEENALRREHGLNRRRYHKSRYTIRFLKNKSENEPSWVAQMDSLSDNERRQHGPWMSATQAMATSTDWGDEAAVQAFKTRLKDYPISNYRAIRKARETWWSASTKVNDLMRRGRRIGGQLPRVSRRAALFAGASVLGLGALGAGMYLHASGSERENI